MLQAVNSIFSPVNPSPFPPDFCLRVPMVANLYLHDSQRVSNNVKALMYKKMIQKKCLFHTKAFGTKNAPSSGHFNIIYNKNATPKCGKQAPEAGLRGKFYILPPLCLPHRSVV